jgi:lipopolysaccharide transport system permease protein
MSGAPTSEASHGIESSHVVEGGRPARGRLRDLVARRGVLWSFLLRELQVRYRQAALGCAWALAQPISLTIAAGLLLGNAAPAEGGGFGRGLFTFTALVPWTYFQAALLGAVPSLVSNANLVRKIWFPRESLPLAVVGAVALDLLLGWCFWIGWLALAGAHVGLALLWSPMLLAILIGFTAACALAGSALNVHWRDVKHALPVLLQLGLLLCPIFYASSSLGHGWRQLVAYQPLAVVMEGMRDVALRGTAPDSTALLFGGLGTLLLLVGAWALYTRADRHFADVV